MYRQDNLIIQYDCKKAWAVRTSPFYYPKMNNVNAIHWKWII